MPPACSGQQTSATGGIAQQEEEVGGGSCQNHSFTCCRSRRSLSESEMVVIQQLLFGCALTDVELACMFVLVGTSGIPLWVWVCGCGVCGCGGQCPDRVGAQSIDTQYTPTLPLPILRICSNSRHVILHCPACFCQIPPAQPLMAVIRDRSRATTATQAALIHPIQKNLISKTFI